MQAVNTSQVGSPSTSANDIRLTQFAKRAGCAAKQSPDFLFALLPTLPPIIDRNVLIGSATADDAAVYKLNDETALVLTTDFFTPIVDNPYDFGSIAATNALSDVYAMGGVPVTALSLVGFPDATLPAEVLREILRGATDKCAEAGIAIVGGHSIKAEEPIFGLSVVGTVHPNRILANSGAQPGDTLILTKPIGLGIITTAAKNGEDSENAIEAAIELMKTLNNRARDTFVSFDCTHALTDVTGFGLLGHLRNVIDASGVSATVFLDQVPVIPAAWNYVKAGITPGGTRANHRFLNEWVTYANDIEVFEQLMLCDAQTSGGLLAVVASESAEAVVARLQSQGLHQSRIIGTIQGDGERKIEVNRWRAPVTKGRPTVRQ